MKFRTHNVIAGLLLCLATTTAFAATPSLDSEACKALIQRYKEDGVRLQAAADKNASFVPKKAAALATLDADRNALAAVGTQLVDAFDYLKCPEGPTAAKCKSDFKAARKKAVADANATRSKLEKKVTGSAAAVRNMALAEFFSASDVKEKTFSVGNTAVAAMAACGGDFRSKL